MKAFARNVDRRGGHFWKSDRNRRSARPALCLRESDGNLTVPLRNDGPVRRGFEEGSYQNRQLHSQSEDKELSTDVDVTWARIPDGCAARRRRSCSTNRAGDRAPASFEALLRSSHQLAALRLTPLRNATDESFLSAAFSSFRFVVSNRMMSSRPSDSAQAISVP